jgi:glycopeptide antibiotics resistance protein
LFTLMPFFIPIPGGNNLFLQSMNLVPYRDVIKGIDGAIREAILNIIMLMPFGFLLPIVSKRNIAAIALFLFIFSISIELMQLLYVWSAGPTSRSFDVTDLINNTIGGMVGYLIFLVFRPFIHKLLKPNKVT